MPAVTDAYATVQRYRATISKTDAADDALIDSDLKAVSRYLDRTLGRFFTQDSAVQARVYQAKARRSGPVRADWAESENPWLYGGLTRWLFTDDIASTSGLIIRVDTDNDGLFTDETALATTDYELRPLNATLGPEPRPYEAIYIPEWSSLSGLTGGQRVQVTALWGWPAIPEAVVSATCHVTGILRLESPRATQRVTELGETISTSRQAREIVDDLTRQYRRAVGAVI